MKLNNNMTASQLKNAILQYAVQGKLVSQNPNDEPASVLLEKIRKERKALIKAGKIKNEKPLLPITDEEIPFDIPKNWEWVRLGEYLDVRDGTHDTPKYVKKGFPLITSKNLNNGQLNIENIQFISEDDHAAISTRSRVDDGDILFAMIGSIGNPVIINKTFDFSIKNVALFKKINPYLNNMKYIFYILMFVQEDMKKIALGGVQSFVSLTFLRNFIIPLSPLSEQHRIVERIEEILPLINEYDKVEQTLTTLDNEFPEKLKKSILQSAIQGKLIPQDSNDEPASVLLERIRIEKKKLIKEGKIKPNKEESIIFRRDNSHYEKRGKTERCIDGEIPFEIPESWAWVRLGEICEKLTDGSHITPKYINNGVPFLSVKDISNGYICFDNVRYVSNKEHNEMYKRCNPERGDILLTKVGTTGIPVLIDTDIHFSLFVSIALLKIFNKQVNNIFLISLLQSPFVKKQCKNKTKGVGNKNWVIRDIANTLIPLPPLNEQKRIQTCINSFFSLSYKLKNI